MSRAVRLLDLLERLRRHRFPVSGATLAAELGISARTLYRDIATLQAQGAAIDGAPGLGYVLRPGFTLPPLMFTADEIEAVALGCRWVAQRADDALAAAARHALAKIGAVVPGDIRIRMDASTLLVGPAEAGPERVDIGIVREAIRAERKLRLAYRDLAGQHTDRVVWPVAIGFFDRAKVVVAWCELRDDFRHFRTDRIDGVTLAEERYPRRRHALMKDWRARQPASGPDEAADRN